DGHAEPVHHLRDRVATLVDAQAGTADTLDALDHRAAGVVLQRNLELALGAFALDREAVDVALVLQDLGNRDFQLRRRHHDDRLLDHLRVADARQHVGDGITHAHCVSPSGRPGLPAGLDHARYVALEGELADLAAAEAELAERAARTTGQLAAIAQPGRVGIARQLLQLQAGQI